jgi:hypothetical protein
MLRLLDDADLEHSEETVVVVPDENDDRHTSTIF